jgi:hypothetical protein
LNLEKQNNNQILNKTGTNTQLPWNDYNTIITWDNKIENNIINIDYEKELNEHEKTIKELFKKAKWNKKNMILLWNIKNLIKETKIEITEEKDISKKIIAIEKMVQKANETIK